MRKVIPYRDVIRILKKHDPRFEEYFASGGGSHRQVYHPDVNGSAKSYPLPYHGEKTDTYRPYLKQLIERFNLPEDIFD